MTLIFILLNLVFFNVNAIQPDEILENKEL